MIRYLALQLTLLLCRIFFFIFADVEVYGRENAPKRGPLIVVANHFSLFEVPLICITLPYAPVFIAARELAEYIFLDFIMWADNSIRIRRGQADRQALKQALDLLHREGILAIFPEGGITAETIAMAARGESTNHLPNVRADAQLLPARDGTSFLAVQSQAPILPIALLGTEQMEGNLKRFRRTKIKIIIGEPFGPLTVDESLRGRAKRREMNVLSHKMMQKVAELMPVENRGYYHGLTDGRHHDMM